ncbi:MarR family winged helix-turn-helix transcriptional regulator [Gorillibacterium massiliense]|uniref:MarR family winged helix-turn-helix transcriptional regulator n=1 Tax=Gorillibacterium massiliense TaxID=1280390 RepID=UPI0004B80619|nr:MarR family transcriptional regulator [Gorillibacterium massiliense]
MEDDQIKTNKSCQDEDGARLMLAGIIQRFFAATFTIHRVLSPMLRNVVPGELTSDQFLTIRYLRDQERVTSSELADSFGVGKSSVTAIITRLAEKGLVEREPDDRDRRVSYLRLTQEGVDLSMQVEANLIQALSRHMGHFTEDEGEQFMVTYERLAKLLAQPDEGSGREK